MTSKPQAGTGGAPYRQRTRMPSTADVERPGYVVHACMFIIRYLRSPCGGPTAPPRDALSRREGIDYSVDAVYLDVLKIWGWWRSAACPVGARVAEAINFCFILSLLVPRIQHRHCHQITLQIYLSVSRLHGSFRSAPLCISFWSALLIGKRAELSASCPEASEKVAQRGETGPEYVREASKSPFSETIAAPRVLEWENSAIVGFNAPAYGEVGRLPRGPESADVGGSADAPRRST